MKRGESGLKEIDLNSLVDIAFLLILFFMLATTFMRPAGDKVQIPSGGHSTAQSKTLTVQMSTSGIIFGDSKNPISMDELQARLASERLPEKEPNQRLVILESAKDVPYSDYFRVVMMITQSGGVLALIDNEGDR
ncbi:MAG TPA: biopolymer transporter ExbD [Planctomycetota bacterium]|jgi:biopolymer transport protein ExbD